MTAKLRILLLTMDDPLFTYSILSTLKEKNIKFVEVCFLGNPKISIKRIITLLIVYGLYNFCKFVVYYLWWNLIKDGRVNALYKNCGINVRFFESNSIHFENFVSNLKPDLIVSVFCNSRISTKILGMAKLGGINLHQGSLPDYKGLMPIFYAKLNNDSKVGSTIHIMDRDFDTGGILIKDEISIKMNENYIDIWNKLNIIGANNLVDILNKIEMTKSIPSITLKNIGGNYYSLPSYSKLLRYFIMNIKNMFCYSKD